MENPGQILGYESGIKNRMLKKIPCFFLVLILLGTQNYPLYGYAQLQQYLYEYGMHFFQQGLYDEALLEFKKALMVQSDYEPALKYIQLIEQAKIEGKGPSSHPTPAAEVFPQIRLEKEVIVSRELERFEKKIPPPVLEAVTIPKAEKKETLSSLALDEYISSIAQPLEIPQGESIILTGRNIQKFLITHP
jgi:tetratricopeptide (TPR) repeat protein